MCVLEICLLLMDFMMLSNAGSQFVHDVGECRDMGRTGTAAATNDINPSGFRKFCDDLGHLFGSLLVFSDSVRQAGIWENAYCCVTKRCEFLDVGSELFCS